VFCDEINNDLFNEFTLYFVNFISELKSLVNLEIFIYVDNW
jgi:hypothetical protein